MSMGTECKLMPACANDWIRKASARNQKVAVRRAARASTSGPEAEGTLAAVDASPSPRGCGRSRSACIGMVVAPMKPASTRTACRHPSQPASQLEMGLKMVLASPAASVEGVARADAAHRLQQEIDAFSRAE